MIGRKQGWLGWGWGIRNIQNGGAMKWNEFKVLMSTGSKSRQEGRQRGERSQVHTVHMSVAIQAENLACFAPRCLHLGSGQQPCSNLIIIPSYGAGICPDRIWTPSLSPTFCLFLLFSPLSPPLPLQPPLHFIQFNTSFSLSIALQVDEKLQRYISRAS